MHMAHSIANFHSPYTSYFILIGKFFHFMNFFVLIGEIFYAYKNHSNISYNQNMSSNN